jgi:hypothetical protein
LENNSRQPKNLTENRLSGSLNNTKLTLSHGVDEEGSCRGVVAEHDYDDDDE